MGLWTSHTFMKDLTSEQLDEIKSSVIDCKPGITTGELRRDIAITLQDKRTKTRKLLKKDKRLTEATDTDDTELMDSSLMESSCAMDSDESQGNRREEECAEAGGSGLAALVLVDNDQHVASGSLFVTPGEIKKVKVTCSYIKMAKPSKRFPHHVTGAMIPVDIDEMVVLPLTAKLFQEMQDSGEYLFWARYVGPCKKYFGLYFEAKITKAISKDPRRRIRYII